MKIECPRIHSWDEIFPLIVNPKSIDSFILSIVNKSPKAIYSLNYHIIWCPKYRQPILIDSIIPKLIEIFQSLALTLKIEILNLAIQPDHIHIFISADPKQSPTSLVKRLKGVSSRYLFKDFPNLKKTHWGGNLWSRSYYIASHGSMSSETIKKYIDGQSHA